jgi:uncharacterized protein
VKLTKWHIKAPLDNGDVILYSTLTGATVVWSKELARHLNGESLDAECFSRFPGEIEQMRKLGLLVSDQTDENAIFRYRLGKMKFDRTLGSFTILTTYRCNLACPYCIQRGVVPDSVSDMSSDTIEATLQWLVAFTGKRGLRGLDIGWFGGEPLLNPEPIERLTLGLRKALPGKRVTGQVVTNGVLLDARMVDLLASLGSITLQVTLDGPPEIHDRRRRVRENDAEGSFGRIFAAIAEALPRLQVVIALNVDHDNVDHVPALLALLATLEPQANLRVFVGYIGQTLAHHRFCEQHTFRDEEISHHYGSLVLQAGKAGLNTANDVFMGLCTWESSNTAVIDPVGNLYNCLSRVGQESVRIGHVSDLDVAAFDVRKGRLAGAEAWEKICYECPYLPLCRGGCRYQALVRYGSWRALNCKKAIFERSYPEILRTACCARYPSQLPR